MISVIKINDAGVEIAYTDSGTTSIQREDYITIFAIHGTGFSRAIFDKVAGLAPKSSIRWVSVSRRNYPGSSPYTQSELRRLQGGSVDDRREMLLSIGTDLANFYDLFIQKHEIPAISEDGKSGGIAILGWSSGCTFALASLIQTNSLQAEARARMSCRIRTLILEDPAMYCLGFPDPPKQYSLSKDATVPSPSINVLSSFATWVAGYFSHGDLSSRSLDILSYTIPERSTIQGIPSDMIVQDPGALLDTRLVSSCMPEAQAMLHNAIFNGSLRLESWPRLRCWILTGEKTFASSIACLWAVEDLDRGFGGRFIKSRIIKDVNHLMHWDHPELMTQVFLDCLYDTFQASLYVNF